MSSRLDSQLRLTAHTAPDQSRGSEAHRAPDRIDRDLTDGARTLLLQMPPQNISIEIGGELSGLRVGDPRDAVGFGCLEGGAAFAVHLRKGRREHENPIGASRGGRDITEVDSARPADHENRHAGLQIEFLGKAHVAPSRAFRGRDALRVLR